ncbi:MAG: PorV/PorQ family protein, partial [Chlorobiales bacterium]|nr:PorV/PorQ family protein [Chlorobiales bacterium]
MSVLNLKKRIFLTIALVGLVMLRFSSVQAQNTITTAVPFLLISPDSRAGGMGEANVAIADNASAVFWNPAGLGFQKGLDLNFTHANWLPAFNADLFYDNLTAKYAIPDYGTFALGITYLNLGEIERRDENNNPLGTFKSYELALGLSYGVKVHPTLALGTAVRYIYSNLSPTGAGSEKGSGTGSSIAFDLAALWRPQFDGYLSDRLSFGLNISNIGPKMTYIDESQADPLPTNLKLGTAFRIFSNDYNK